MKVLALVVAAYCCAVLTPWARADCLPPPEALPELPVADALPPATTGTRLSGVAPSGVLPPDLAHQGETQNDLVGRVVAPVYVNGQGPFRFIVDTGANRSVLSARLAGRLGLEAISRGDVHSIAGVTQAPFVSVDALNFGAVDLREQQMPVLDGGVFAGEMGLLGVDGMHGRRLRINFRQNCIEIRPARGAPPLRNFVTVRGELRFGHLLIVDARVQNVPIRVLIDTGSDSSFANVALRDALSNLPDRRTDVHSYSAGQLLVLEHGLILPRITLAGVEIRNVPAYVGDFHIFELWGLHDEPTLLLGMNVLSRTEELAVDYERGLLQFRIRGRDDIGITRR